MEEIQSLINLTFGSDELFAIHCEVCEPVDQWVNGKMWLTVQGREIGNKDELESLLVPADRFATRAKQLIPIQSILNDPNSQNAYSEAYSCILKGSIAAFSDLETGNCKESEFKIYNALLFPSAGPSFDFWYGTIFRNNDKIVFCWGRNALPEGTIVLAQSEIFLPITAFWEEMHSLQNDAAQSGQSM